MKKLSLDELNRLELEEFKKVEKIPVCVVLDNIRSALNVGSIFRTSDAFRIEKVYCVGITAVPPHREILKTALGATESVEWTYIKNISELAKELKAKGFEWVVLEQADRATDLRDFKIDRNKKYAIVFGNEVGGVSDECFNEADRVIELPQYGTKHSLNVAVCAGIVLWHISGCWLQGEG